MASRNVGKYSPNDTASHPRRLPRHLLRASQKPILNHMDPDRTLILYLNVQRVLILPSHLSPPPCFNRLWTSSESINHAASKQVNFFPQFLDVFDMKSITAIFSYTIHQNQNIRTITAAGRIREFCEQSLLRTYSRFTRLHYARFQNSVGWRHKVAGNKLRWLAAVRVVVESGNERRERK